MDVTVNDLALGDRQALVVAVDGELDGGSATLVEERAQPAICERRPLILDLSSCTFIDSIGLRLVLRLQRALGAIAMQMVVVIGQPNVWRVFSMTSVSNRVRVFLDRDAATHWLAA